MHHHTPSLAGYSVNAAPGSVWNHFHDDGIASMEIHYEYLPLARHESISSALTWFARPCYGYGPDLPAVWHGVCYICWLS